MASVVTVEGYIAPHDLVSKVGQLLLSTLTTLKHAGAAFAARDALQQIAIYCLNLKKSLDTHSLPAAWSKRLLQEISLNERVRNSTLRRSTGLALGFLAIMRADVVATKSISSAICHPLLQDLLMLSLPPERRIEDALAKLNIVDQASQSKVFVYSTNLHMDQTYVLDSKYEVRQSS